MKKYIGIIRIMVYRNNVKREMLIMKIVKDMKNFVKKIFLVGCVSCLFFLWDLFWVSVFCGDVWFKWWMFFGDV